jgi:hypothetical protein
MIFKKIRQIVKYNKKVNDDNNLKTEGVHNTIVSPEHTYQSLSTRRPPKKELDLESKSMYTCLFEKILDLESTTTPDQCI